MCSSLCHLACQCVRVCVCVCCSLAAGQSKKLKLSPPFAICYTRSLLLSWLCPLSNCLPLSFSPSLFLSRFLSLFLLLLSLPSSLHILHYMYAQQLQPMQKIIEAQQATDILTPSPIFLPLPPSLPSLHSPSSTNFISFPSASTDSSTHCSLRRYFYSLRVPQVCNTCLGFVYIEEGELKKPKGERIKVF